MCGIVGYVGTKNCLPIIIESLKRLEYRGYDSAGIGFIQNKNSHIFKSVGKVAELENKINEQELNFKIGIGHTRWATHGIPNSTNAHPHHNSDNSILVIHNGIIENYSTIKKQLEDDGYTFYSETDSEVIPNLIDKFIKNGKDFFTAVQLSLNELEGTYGIAVLHKNEPEKIIVAKNGSPLVIGIGNNENFIASDVNALISYTNHIVYLEDGEIAEVYANKFVAKNIHDKKIDKEIIKIEMELDQISKGGYPHFMLKEIMEQKESIQNSFRGRTMLEDGNIRLGGLIGFENRLVNSDRFILIGCGTSWHSALIGKYMLEQFTRIPTEVEYASEFRYRNPVINKNDTIFFISQSGETADTLAALKEAKTKGALCLGICNVVGSSISRESHAGVYIHAGPEIGVASTKAFTSQLVVLALITIFIARRKHLSLTDGKETIKEMHSIPEKIDKILSLNDRIKTIAKDFVNAKNFIYLGRGYNFPVALEGALKLKEISYIHAEGYPAAEMKHGPIALIDNDMPAVIIAPKDSVYEKVISNIQEIKARNGKIIAIASENDTKIDSLLDYTIKIPDTIRLLMPILTVIPLQLLAYHIAALKGLDVDQPRNLAKSVTVE